jgi:hypothetical protein
MEHNTLFDDAERDFAGTPGPCAAGLLGRLSDVAKPLAGRVASVTADDLTAPALH